MHDPFPIPPPSILVSLTRPISNRLGLVTLPLHIHEILFSSLLYTIIASVVSPYISSRLLPRLYPHFPKRTRLNWDVHVVSLFQSTLVCTLGLYVMLFDDERREMDWQERVWGYTGAGGMVQAFAAGYFLWDLSICVRYFRIFGLGLLAHAVAALVVFSFGFRPFVNYYGPTFILYELSSPFLNFHWFFDKVNMTGSRAQWYNGILLLASFFSCRLLWGTYQSIRVYQDVWAGIHFDASSRLLERAKGAIFEPLGEADEVMRYAGAYMLPTWLATVYLISNVVLNTLNFFWFGKMIETVSKRFREPKNEKRKRKASIDRKEEGVMVEGLADTETIGDIVCDGPDGVVVTMKPDVKTDVTASGLSIHQKTVTKRRG